MIASARHVGLAAACAMLLTTGMLAPADAQDASCKTDIVTATGRTKFRPFSKTKETEGRGAAMADAVANWRIQVDDQFGEEWNAWSRAKDTSFKCAPTKQGRFIGSSFIACTISGRPCLRADTSGREQAKADDRDDRAKREDRDGREDRGGRSRDKGKRVAAAEQLYGERRHVERRNKGSRAYQREMARQDRLAAQRRRAEARAYAREMARQRHLAAARDRAEARVWARIDARHRYLADHRR